MTVRQARPAARPTGQPDGPASAWIGDATPLGSAGQPVPKAQLGLGRSGRRSRRDQAQNRSRILDVGVVPEAG